MYKKAAPIAILAAVALLAGCSSTGPADNDEAADGFTITVGTSNDAPFSTVDEATGGLSGLDGDMLMAMAEARGWEIETYVTDFSTLIPALTTNRIDIVVDAMYITDERKKQVNFTDPWYNEGEALVVAEDDTSIKSRDDVAGLKIGSVTGTVYADLANTLNASEVLLYDDQATLLQAVQNGQIVAAITDSVVAGYSLAQNPGQNLKLVSPYEAHFPGTIGAAIRKDDKRLLDEVNDALAELKKSPKYLEILNSYGLDETHAED